MRLPSVELFYRYFPAFDALRTYTREDLGKDLFAGITVATVAIPQAMAYAVIAGVHPQYGLYTAIVMTLVGAIFDSSRLLINGPTNAISITIFSAIAVFPEAERVPAAITLAFLVGVIQIGITAFRLGDLTRYVSYGVILGFTVGAALLIILSQLRHLLGLEGHGHPHDPFLYRFWMTITGSAIEPAAAAIGIGSILFLLFLKAAKRHLPARRRMWLPEFLLTVAAATVVSALIRLDQHGERLVVGAIPAALPSFQPPPLDWSAIRDLSDSALAIALLGLLEALAMAKVLVAGTGRKLDVHQQCLSEGLANLTSSFFQCFPGSGSLTRSSINRQAGGVSQWAAVFSALIVAATVLVLAPLAYFIPYSALAAILMVSVWGLIDWKRLAYHVRISRFDTGIILATALTAIFISVEFCVIVGVLLSFLLYVPRAAKVDMTELIVTAERVIRERTPQDPICDRLLLFDLNGELFFGSAPELEQHFRRIARRVTDTTRFVVLRCKYARNPDAVSMACFDEFVREMRRRHVKVLFCGVRPDLLNALQRSGLAYRVGLQQIYPERNEVMSSTLQAVRRAYDELNGDYCLNCPRRTQRDDDEVWYYMI